MSSQQDEDIARVKEACQALGEHFDSVHIFTTRHEPEIEDGTVVVNSGVGNWYSRYGAIVEWVTKQEENARLDAREDRKE
jgi:hypothetical protein